VRSLLFVPGDSPERFAPAERAGADAVVIDLADAIPVEGKDEARKAVQSWLRAARDEVTVWIRINAGELGHRDVHALVGPAVTGVCVAGTASASQLAALATVLAEAEEAHRLPLGSIAVAPVLDTAAAVLGAAEIARAPRVTRLQLGEAALRDQLGVEFGPDEREMHLARSLVVLASAAAGIGPPVAPLSPPAMSPEQFRSSTEALRRLGFRGRACVDADQVAIVNDVFS
jgi:citrate lyase subunit beta / citryl-CoA lyase